MSEFLRESVWAVVGGHYNPKNPTPDRLYARLIEGKKQVFRVNPSSSLPKEYDVFHSLIAIDKKIDVVNLVINPAKGIHIVEDMAKLGIKKLWIQPGASSPEILQTANKFNIDVHEGCVLKEANWSNL